MSANPVFRSHFTRWSAVLAAGLMACASVPPLDPELDGIRNRSQQIAAQLGLATKVKGTTDLADGQADFAAYYSGMGLQAIGVKSPTADGGSAKTIFYVSNGRVFYIIETTSGGTAKSSQTQVFYDDAGTLAGSRTIVDGRVSDVSGQHIRNLMNLYATVLAAANQARGPGYKIQFDLSKINELGLAGPPLHAVRYHFCFPADASYAKEIEGIDSTATISREATPDCQSGEWQATGTTNQPGYKQVLLDLAGLPYVQSIQEASRP